MRSVHKSILNTAQGIDPPPKTLLDVGCGDGSFTRVLSHSLPVTFITALDRAKPKYFSTSTMGSFIPGSVDDLPFENNSFDAVTVSLSLHHWEDKEKGILEINRVLKSGGSLIIGDPLLQGWLANPFLGRLAQSIDRGSFAATHELQMILENAGFIRIQINEIPNSFKSVFLITAIK